MLQTPLDQIDENAVNEFVERARLPESPSLDYKRDYDLSTSKGKKGLLADVCALANYGGGHLLIGVDEERDEDDAKTGFPVFPPRGAKQFSKSVAEDVLHASIDPRVGDSVEIREVPGSWNDGSVFVVRVGRSWNVPHCVRDKEQRTFYKRSGTKSEPMDMSQIRESFVQSAGLADRILTFHRDRCARVLNGPTTFPLARAAGVAVVHVVPLSHFASGSQLPLSSVPTLRPGGSGSGMWDPVPNFDGRIAFSGGDEMRSYIQVFRSGAVESVETDLVWIRDEVPKLRATKIEKSVVNALVQSRAFFESQNIDMSCVVRLTVDGVKGALIPPPNNGFDMDDARPIELDRLEFPDVQMNTLDGEVEERVRPLFDILWQSSGWPRSQSFDQHGRYKFE